MNIIKNIPKHIQTGESPYLDETGAVINPHVCYLKFGSKAPQPREPSEEEKALWREQTEASRQLRKIGKEQWLEYKDWWTNFQRPRMEASYKYIQGLGSNIADLGERVRKWDSEGRITAESDRAAGMVAREYDRAKSSVMNSLNRFGMNTGKFAGALRTLALGKASDQANARNMTRFGILDRGMQNRMNLANVEMNYANLLQGGQMTPNTGVGTIATGDQGLARVSGQMAQQRQHEDAMAMQRWQSNQSMLGGLFGGLGSIFGGLSAASIAAGKGAFSWLPFSDIRVKTKIRQIDTLPHDLPLYEYAYIDAPDVLYTGVMAHELQEIKPHLVFEDEETFLHVDYYGLITELIEDAESMSDIRPNIMQPVGKPSGLQLARINQ